MNAKTTLKSSFSRHFSIATLTPVIYVRIAPDRLAIKNVSSGEVIDETPEVAFGVTAKGGRKVLAIGKAARGAMSSTAVEIVNPFAHPRTLVSDFTTAEFLIKSQLSRLVKPFLKLIRPAPVIVLHPLGNPLGGFTQIELRAIRELGFGAGGSQVYVWTGRELSDAEVLAKPDISTKPK